MAYSHTFKQAALQKLLDPRCLGLRSVARELGVSPETLRRWRLECQDIHEEKDGTMGRKRPQDWSAEEKYRAVLETASLNEAECSEYCRRNGLHTQHLELWREQCLAGMRKGPSVDVEKKRLKTEIKHLKREIHHKDKALSATTALLVLKKKADLIFGEIPDEEG